MLSALVFRTVLCILRPIPYGLRRTKNRRVLVTVSVRLRADGGRATRLWDFRNFTRKVLAASRVTAYSVIYVSRPRWK